LEEKQAEETGSSENQLLKHDSDQAQPLDESDIDFLLPGRVEERRGSRPGDVRVRIVRPSHPEFRRIKVV